MQKGSADNFADLASPQGEGFPPSPKGTLNGIEFVSDVYYSHEWDDMPFGLLGQAGFFSKHLPNPSTAIS